MTVQSISYKRCRTSWCHPIRWLVDYIYERSANETVTLTLTIYEYIVDDTGLQHSQRTELYEHTDDRVGK